MASSVGKRPFWMHQLAEYVIGGVLVAQGLQSPDPVAPSIAGLLVLLNAATVRGGALSAFRLVGRATHRVLDVVVIAAVVALALQPWVEVDAGARIVMVGTAAVLGVVWWQSSFVEKPRRGAVAPGGGGGTGDAGDRSVELGRKAGRMVGDGINLAKRTAADRKASKGRRDP